MTTKKTDIKHKAGLVSSGEPEHRPSQNSQPPIAGANDIQGEADAIVLTQYSPAGFVVNEALNIIQFRGDTSQYLRPAPGQASLNILKMVSENLVAELRAALHQAKKEDVPVRKERSRLKQGRQIKYINIDVVPFKSSAPGERCFLVLFEGTIPPPPPLTKGGRGDLKGQPGDAEIARLSEELDASKAYLNTITAEYDAANEELRALNEELQSSNEEMQSINEEMETAKEELQSTNEELTTVNDELQSRNEEMKHLNNDLLNVLKGVEIPIIILGSELQIRRFNDAAAKLLNLIPQDTGRPLSDIRTNIVIPDLEQMVLEAINTLAVKEKEVQDLDGCWYSLTLRPYKTVDNRIDGVLMTLVDINELRLSLSRIKRAYDYANAIVEAVREPLLVLAPDLRVITANKSFYEDFVATPEETENRFIYDLGDRRWDRPELRDLLEKVLPQDKVFSDFEVEVELPNMGRRVMIINARKIYLEAAYSRTHLNVTEPYDRLILLAIEDITERKDTEKDLQERSTELEASYKDMESFSYSVSHDLRAPLRIISGLSEIVLKDHYDKLDDEGKKLLRLIEGNTKRMDQLVMALLDLSKIGRQDMNISEIAMEKAASLIAADMKAATPERNITVTVGKLPPAYGDFTLIRQVFTNLLSNAFKFTQDRDAAVIEVGSRRDNGENVYYVKDNGTGFDMEYADKLFKVFQRLHSMNEFEGIGIGLSIVERIIRRHGGRVWAEAKPGEGAVFYFSLPVRQTDKSHLKT